MSDSFATPWAAAHRLLCPWEFPGKNTRVGYHFLVQGIFLTQGWKLHFLNWQVDSFSLRYLGSAAPHPTRTHGHAACAFALSPQRHWKSTRAEPTSTIYYQRHTAKCLIGPELKIKVCKLGSLTSLRANNKITW